MGSLSDNWRKNTSSCEPVELANLFRALRKVAGHLGPNVGSIEYAGMSHFGETSSIVLDPVMVMGRYRKAMQLQYGKTLQFLIHFGLLPQAMEKLLKWTFLYGAKPHLWGGRPFSAGPEAS